MGRNVKKIEAEHGIPAIDRAVDILECLAGCREPLSIREITRRTGLVRSTVYRSLNTLAARGLVREAADRAFNLGPQQLRLARAVPQGADLVTLARPIIAEAAVALELSVKLSVLDGDDALVVATAEAPRAYTITTQVGRRFPLHAGGASKMLLAAAPEELRRAYLARPLRAFTRRTLTDPKALGRELGGIVEAGFALDRGEYADGVFAAAVPVIDRSGACIAAISAPFHENTGEATVLKTVATLRQASARLAVLIA
jgi:DNA-binding IclR family transcriptional regulator